MSGGYTKLFSDIVDSSIWSEPMELRIVWVTLLALSDQNGFVRGSAGWLAGKSKVPLDQCLMALERFKLPDPQSRTPDYEGRRIEQLPDGWLILNYILFRDRLSTNPIAIQTRERVKKHRERYNALRNAESVTASRSASAFDTVVEKEGRAEGRDANVPTAKEWVKACAQYFIPEWYAMDKYHAKCEQGWGRNWRAHVSRVKGWYENDGKPTAPIKRNGNGSKPQKGKSEFYG